MKLNPKTALLPVLLLLGSLAVAERHAGDEESNIDDPRVQHHSFLLPATVETIPYTQFAPSNYDDAIWAPILVSLHDLGRNCDWLVDYHGLLDTAETRAPLNNGIWSLRALRGRA